MAVVRHTKDSTFVIIEAGWRGDNTTVAHKAHGAAAPNRLSGFLRHGRSPHTSNIT